MKYKIVLSEDNLFLAKAIAEKLQFFDDLTLKFHAKNGAELIGKLELNHHIDVILMDIQMPEMDGITATKIVKKKYPHIKIIMLTVADDDENIFKSIQAGADGYLLKETDALQLHHSLLDVINGGAPMTPVVAFKTLKLLRNPESYPQIEPHENIQLTKREIEILEQISKGLNYTQIADNLIISQGTVRKHIENIYTKLKVHNKIEAVSMAKSKRIIG